MVCDFSTESLRSFNIERHYNEKHRAKYDVIVGDERNLLVEVLKAKKARQRGILFKETEEIRRATKTSYMISELIARAGRPFADGEFVKECLLAISNEYPQETVKSLLEIPLSASTVQRRIETLGMDAESQLRSKLQAAQYYSLCLDESCDITGSAQVIIFIRSVMEDFSISEDLANVVSIDFNVNGATILKAIDDTVELLSLYWSKMVAITTDGAPYMTGNQAGLVGLLASRFPNGDGPFHFHCFIHQQVLCTKAIAPKNSLLRRVMDDFATAINFIRSSDLRLRLFNKYVETELGEAVKLIYHTDVRWLSRGYSSNRFFEVYDVVIEFFESANLSESMIPVFERMKTIEWKFLLGFFADITRYFNELNLSLQGGMKSIVDLYCLLKNAIITLPFMEAEIRSLKFDRFSKCRSVLVEKNYQPNEDIVVYLAECLHAVKQMFSARFQDLQSHSPIIRLLLNPFCEIESIAHGKALNEEILLLNADSVWRTVFIEALPQGRLLFYSLIDSKFEVLRDVAKRYSSIFGTTYNCETAFSRVNFIKNEFRSRLTDQNLRSLLRIRGDYSPNYDFLMSSRR